MSKAEHPRSLAVVDFEGGKNMESRAKLFGHPIHSILVTFPLGLFSTSLVFDVVYLLTGNGKWSEISFWIIAAGVIGGLAAAVFGLIDWLAIPSGTRAKSVGLWHGASNVVVVVVFVVSWLLRADAPDQPGVVPIVLSFVGVGLASLGGWLGGELIGRLGVGVTEGAHLNAPSSLSGRPASEGSTGRAKRGVKDMPDREVRWFADRIKRKPESKGDDRGRTSEDHRPR
jgi:uncharacterized membrane protein